MCVPHGVLLTVCSVLLTVCHGQIHVDACVVWVLSLMVSLPTAI